jgi:hypothetical protein
MDERAMIEMGKYLNSKLNWQLGNEIHTADRSIRTLGWLSCCQGYANATLSIT